MDKSGNERKVTLTMKIYKYKLPFKISFGLRRLLSQQGTYCYKYGYLGFVSRTRIEIEHAPVIVALRGQR